MKTAVLVFPGSNCDHDAYHALRHVVGVDAEFVWHKRSSLEGFDAVVIPGGFTYGRSVVPYEKMAEGEAVGVGLIERAATERPEGRFVGEQGRELAEVELGHGQRPPVTNLSGAQFHGAQGVAVSLQVLTALEVVLAGRVICLRGDVVAHAPGAQDSQRQHQRVQCDLQFRRTTALASVGRPREASHRLCRQKT